MPSDGGTSSAPTPDGGTDGSTTRWVTTDTSAGQHLAFATAADPAGNLFVAQGVAPDEATFASAWLTKYDPHGEVIWTLPLQSQNGDWDLRVATTRLGNVFVAGGGWLRKISPSGTLDWQRAIGPLGGLAVNPNGGAIVSEDPNLSCMYERCSPGRITQFAYDGTQQWEHDNGTVSDWSNFIGLTTDPVGDVFTFDGRGHLLEFGPDGTLSQSNPSSVSGELAYSSSGLWVSSYQGFALIGADGRLRWNVASNANLYPLLVPMGDDALVSEMAGDDDGCADLRLFVLDAQGKTAAERDFPRVFCPNGPNEPIAVAVPVGISAGAPYFATRFRGTVDFGRGPVTSEDVGFALVEVEPLCARRP